MRGIMNAPESYAKFLINTRKSESTIKAYCHDVDLYLKWHNNQVEFQHKEMSRESIMHYLDHLKNRRSLSNKTINRIISSLAKYNEYLVAIGSQKHIVVNKKDLFKYEADLSSFRAITKNEIEQLIVNIKACGNTRNYALVVLLANTGMRLSEALNMRIGDIDFKEGICVIRSNKKGKQRVVPLDSESISAIHDYLSKRTINDSEYLFISNRNGRLNETVINRVFRQFSDIVTPRHLRYSFCINLLEIGTDVFTVSKLLGYSDITTALTYLNTITENSKNLKQIEDANFRY